MRRMLIACVILFVGCGGRDDSRTNRENDSGRAAVSPVPALPFTVINRETQMKGASLNPPTSPTYKLSVVKAALTDPQLTLTKETVAATLTRLLQQAKAEASGIDGVTVFLYQSTEHANGANAALGRAEWWPKNHTFDASNERNIANKSSYVETVEVFALPVEPGTAAEQSRLPESTRREIFIALVRSQDRATKEAEAKYPIVATNIPIEKLRGYDFTSAFTKNAAEDEHLQAKYRRELLANFKISEAELKAIEKEAFDRNWPLPRSR